MSSEIQKVLDIEPERLAAIAVYEKAQAPTLQITTVLGVFGTVCAFGLAGSIAAVGIAAAAGLFIAKELMTLVSIHQAGERRDFNGVLGRLPKQRRRQLMTMALEMIEDEQPAIAPAKAIDTTAVDVSTPFKLADLKPSEPAPVPQGDDLDRYWDAPVASPADDTPVSGFDVADDLSGIPEEDLAKTIGLDPSDESNYLFVGRSGSGKTSFILNAMSNRLIKDTKTQWLILNGKPERGNNWGGLTETRSYLSVNTEERAVTALKYLTQYQKKLAEWQDSGARHTSLFVVADEVNNQRSLLDEKEAKIHSKYLALVATQGRSEGCGLWLSTHSHLVSDVGLNRQVQTSFQVVALGREGKLESVAAAIADPYIIRDEELRAQLKAKLRIFNNLGGQGAIAFTTQGGNTRLVRLPVYSKNVQIAPQGDRHDAVVSSCDSTAANISPEDQALIGKMKALKAEHPNWGKVAVLTAATGRRPGGSPEYVRAQELYSQV